MRSCGLPDPRPSVARLSLGARYAGAQRAVLAAAHGQRHVFLLSMSAAVPSWDPETRGRCTWRAFCFGQARTSRYPYRALVHLPYARDGSSVDLPAPLPPMVTKSPSSRVSDTPRSALFVNRTGIERLINIPDLQHLLRRLSASLGEVAAVGTDRNTPTTRSSVFRSQASHSTTCITR